MSFDAEPTESIYLPLSHEAGVRLLTLKLPEPGFDRMSLIEAQMDPIPMDQARHTYVALSYTWGDPKTLHAIRVNGQEIQVWQNLYNFLIRSRECMADRRDGVALFETVELTGHGAMVEIYGPQRGPRDEVTGHPQYPRNMPIWIDALCLDQTNVAELNENVSRMKQVYAEAHTVVVWLGNETETTKEVMITLQSARMQLTMDRLALSFGDILNPENHAVVDAQGREVFSRLGPAPDLDNWKAVTSLLEHPYWQRMWVVQELAYTLPFASIWCGRRQMWPRSLCKVQRAYFGEELADTGIGDYTYPRYDGAESAPPALIEVVHIRSMSYRTLHSGHTKLQQQVPAAFAKL